ncbi:MAG TPA: ATP-binding cassette domain-containing protein [Polyangiales bacterium]|nr:ATP-binding cassette domain-containing protein [Polyangiales bacterium]
MRPPSNNVHSNALDPVVDLLWPNDRVGDAIYALASAAGMPTTNRESLVPDARLSGDDLYAWISAAADRSGVQAKQVVVALDEICGLIRHGAPLLLRVKHDRAEGFLAIVGGSRTKAHVLCADLRRRSVPLAAVAESLTAPFSAPVQSDLDALMDSMRIPARKRGRVHESILMDRLKHVRLRGCWLLRLPAGSAVGAEAREIGAVRRLAALAGLHFTQYGLFVLSWYLLGRGLVNGAIDNGWLIGWLLLVVSLAPLRVATTWTQGVLTTTVGAAVRRRLLRGALNVDRELVKSQGAGQLFGLVAEAQLIESLALNGGITALFAVAELLAAALVVWAGAGLLSTTLLAGCTAVALILSWRYLRARRTWTGERLTLTHTLLESMLGHRTRLAQQPRAQWHPREDQALAQYIERGRDMDRLTLGLAFVPRTWLMLGIAGIVPAVLVHSSPALLAASVGGILLAHRALKRLISGLSSLTGAAIAARILSPLVEAAAVREPAPHPSLAVAPPAAGAPLAVQARKLSFRYPRQTDRVLDDCDVTISQGARVLLEGASGAGKTTFASILAGLDRPDSGMLLVNGLDREVLGRTGWNRQVVLAPQAHDNYLVTGSLAFNLLMGRRWPAQRADLQEAEEVCRELGLGELLDRLPAGMQQIVGETGWQLSQGERTRVFLARALLQKPEVLVLDESFSTLDPENLDRTIRTVQRRAGTVLAVAHT